MTEIANWANALIGKALPEFPQWRIVRIIRFQVVQQVNEYSALLLIEVIGIEPDDMEHIELRAEDIRVIEELTATIDEEPFGGSRVVEM